MQSLGSCSEWPSKGSLSSITRCLFSEGDQTEDEVSTAASLEGDVAAGMGKTSPEPFATERPLRPEAHSVCGDQQACGRTPACGDLTSVSSTRALTEGDLAFSRKCAELQGYIRPLLELLNGLKTGRFDRGLSTFQQSVAMDRLQRIVGILQKPQLGEKYMRTLLQVEMMLKVWFPQVSPCQTNSTSLPQDSAASPPPRWHQNHLPMKKRRLSWSDSETLPPTCKQTREIEPEQSPTLTSSELTCPDATASAHTKDPDAVFRHQGQVMSESEGILNPETSSHSQSGGSCSDTQDCSVSSTTPTSDPCQVTGKREAVFTLRTLEWVQDVNGESPKKRAGRKSCLTEKQST
ncbi:circadian associated repressor of transcription a [Salminus brasiliensis]|uniref:circadian associated repressor of transcription a n=1 Tax=Salminus brasiliensis TaxID=930266 RepID=UPI003B837BFD